MSRMQKIVKTNLHLLKLLLKTGLKSTDDMRFILQQSNENKVIKILGNGSSLNSQIDDLNENSQTDYMVVNRFVLSEAYSLIQPKYYVLHDKHFSVEEEGLSICRKINEVTDWDLVIFFPKMFTNHQNLAKTFTNPKIKIVVYNNYAFDGLEGVAYRLYSKNIAMPKAQNVMGAAIYLATCLKYKVIELYGVEHSWTKDLRVNDNNEVCLENPHFFDKQKTELKTWKQIQGADAKLHEALRLYAFMFESYHNLKKFADINNVKIINCSPNSFIDAFERKN
jgi:hypothetical protein